VYAAASDMESRRSVRDGRPITNIFWNWEIVSSEQPKHQKEVLTPRVAFDISSSRSCWIPDDFSSRTSKELSPGNCVSRPNSPLKVARKKNVSVKQQPVTNQTLRRFPD
jgi:hypothetical protein